MSKHIQASFIFILLIIIAALSGCSQPSPQPSASAPAPQPAATPAATPPATPVAAPAAAPAGALATTDGDLPGLRVAVTELKRTSTTLTLKFTLINDGDKDHSIYAELNESPYKGYQNVSGTHLIDTASKKKYFVVADSDQNCLCSDKVPDIPKKSQSSLWAKFPAPPDDVQKMTVQIPHFVPMEDIPISK